MNAQTLTFRAREPREEVFAVPFDGQFLRSRIGAELREQHCPSCHALVYSRRQGRCGVCERVLPEEFRFNQSELDRLEAMLQAERQRHRAWLIRHE